MPAKETTGSKGMGAVPLMYWGEEQSQAVLAFQKELLASYEEVSRVWLARMQSQYALWSDLASKMTSTRSVPEAFEAYTKCVSESIKMAAEDGQRLAEEAQKTALKMTKSLGGAEGST
jgi:erythromycin esterase-like protein